jgi:uncharacterized coiled-coil protein SlyX
MTTPIHQTIEERIAELESRVAVLESTIVQLRQYIQHQTKEQLTKIVEEAVHRSVAAIEAEWTGTFLPELRRTVKADVKETLQRLSNSDVSGS